MQLLSLFSNLSKNTLTGDCTSVHQNNLKKEMCSSLISSQKKGLQQQLMGCTDSRPITPREGRRIVDEVGAMRESREDVIARLNRMKQVKQKLQEQQQVRMPPVVHGTTTTTTTTPQQLTREVSVSQRNASRDNCASHLQRSMEEGSMHEIFSTWTFPDNTERPSSHVDISEDPYPLSRYHSTSASRVSHSTDLSDHSEKGTESDVVSHALLSAAEPNPLSMHSFNDICVSTRQ